MTDQEYDNLLRSMSIESPSYDFGDIDLGSQDFGSNFDRGSFENLAAVDMGNLADMDFGNLNLADLGNIGDIDLGGGGIDALLGGGPLPFNESEYGKDLDRPNLENPNFDKNKADRAEYQRYLDSLTPENQERSAKYAEEMGGGKYEFDWGPDAEKNWASFDKNLTDIMQNRGGFTSQWQQVGTDRIMINDDGTGIGINENGDSYALNGRQVNQMIKNGQLNTFESGYNTATGGTKIAPGGGRPVTLNNGKTGTLKPDGTVIDNDTGVQIGTDKDVRGGGGGGGGGGSKTSTGTKPNTGMNALLPLLLALLAMNRGGGGGGGGRGAVIPNLTATQRQTPYAQQQRAPGYRPGQGGITYFEPTQFAPRMAAGGGIGSLNTGRLLQGPGDGVSDSIPAVITDGMSEGGQPAKVARGEYIFDARSVAALGNGSTDAGAERLDKMRENILRDDRKAGIGEDSKAYRHLMA